MPVGERRGQLGGVDVDALAADPVAQPDLQRHHPDPAGLRQSFGQVGGGVGDDGDRHDGPYARYARRGGRSGDRGAGHVPGPTL